MIRLSIMKASNTISNLKGFLESPWRLTRKEMIRGDPLPIKIKGSRQVWISVSTP